MSRIRQQRRRERLKAEKLTKTLEKPATEKPVTKSVQQQEDQETLLQRQKWSAQKTKERKGWSSQKWRRHREKCRAYYYKQKISEDTEKCDANAVNLDQCQATKDDMPGKESARKSLCRAKASLMKVHSTLFGKLHDIFHKVVQKSPRKKQAVDSKHHPEEEMRSPKRMQLNMQKAMDDLGRKRSKQSLCARRLLLNAMNGKEMQMSSTNKYKRKNKFSKSEAATEFLENVAVCLPGKKTVSKKTMTQKKILPKRERRLYKEFKKQHPQHQISLRSFYRSIPKHILTATNQKYRESLCEYCTGVDLKLDALNGFLSSPIDGRDALSELSLCTTPSLACYNRTCCSCGTEVAKTRIFSDLTVRKDMQVRWKSWEMIQRDRHKHLELVDREGTINLLIRLLLAELEKFSYHLFVARWQHNQYRASISSVSEHPDLAVAVFDFSENYLCKYQDEVQAAHWGYSQITVHPVVVYYKCSQCTETVTEYLVFLSDDITHDASFVKTITTKTLNHLATKMDLKKLIIFSDGCASQYKSRLPWYQLATMSEPVFVERAYFGSRHGKSPCDACGGIVKRLVDDDVLAREVVIQNASAMHTHCSKYYTLPSTGSGTQSNECGHTKR